MRLPSSPSLLRGTIDHPWGEAWLLVALDAASAWGLLQEGVDRKGKVFLTCAGWVRHVALALHYLRTLEVLDMSGPVYRPHAPRLGAVLDDKSGVDTPEKAFAFALGVLFGKLMAVQAARGVNVASNALTWLRRGTLAGRDLPAFYNRVREKLLTYGTEKSAAVREVVEEASRLGLTLGDRIALDVETTMYFLFLGQALSAEVLPSSEDKKVAA